MSQRMWAIRQQRYASTSRLNQAELERPQPRHGELIVKVHATGVNRVDLLQCAGNYPVPDGQSDILGIEIAGEVAALGDGVTRFSPGQRVFGVVDGGGYAQYCRIDEGMALPIPDGWSFATAAATPEAGLTSDETLFTLGNLDSGQTVLIHAGASGISTLMIQMAKQAGARVITTVGSREKAALVESLGADHAVLYRQRSFAEATLSLTDGQGVDLVVDFIGAPYLDANTAVLKEGGTLVLAGLLGGDSAPLDLRRIVKQRIQIKGSSLRIRSASEKRAVNQRFAARWMTTLAARRIEPVVYAQFPLDDADKALEALRENRNLGKIVLDVPHR